MKKLSLLLFIFISSLGYSQHVILLYSDTIQQGDANFDFTTGGIGAMTGSNLWVINNSYSGGSGIPATTPEDSVVIGTITHAPFSYYLHIYDSTGAVSTGVRDCDWNPANASDRFVFLNNGICSLGMDSVTFTFFWIAGGDSSSYGELYYRTNGGSWIQTGRPKYSGQTDWLYEQITDPAFSNVQNLQFGFRWVNPGGTTSPDMSFGVDDIIAVGTYDSVANPIHMHVTSFFSDTVCMGQYVYVNFSLSAPLCDGQYEAEILNAAYQNVTGSSIPDFFVSAGDTTGSFVFGLPGSLQGNCFHVVLKRTSPAPYITSDTSGCFSIVACANSIFTASAPVMTDSARACVMSTVDVYFSSTGTFNANNIYTAQLSDSFGSFGSPYTLGTLHSGYYYSSPTGDIAGAIPAGVPPGCGYYIRVISSSPSATGSVIGPFCLKDCDLFTNNGSDLHYCIGYPNATDTQSLVITTHEWNNNTTYDSCNNFSIQLLDPQTFAPVNTGGLGVYHVNHSDTFQLIVGPPDTLTARGILPGEYYLRLVSSCSSSPTDTAGSVVRISIGAPNPVGDTLFAFPDTVCFNVAAYIILRPFNTQSTYEWFSPDFNSGLPSAFGSGFNEFGIIFNSGATPGFYPFVARENNFGCWGPWGPIDSILAVGDPSAQLTGPASSCVGDTIVLSATFDPATYWTWTIPTGAQDVLLGNNERGLIFASAGTYMVWDVASNFCGTSSDSTTITINESVTFQQSDTIWNILTMHAPALTGGWPPGGHYSGSFVVADSLLNVIAGINGDTAFTVTYTNALGNGCNTSASLVFVAGRTTGIPQPTDQMPVSLYPNPNGGSFILQTSAGQGKEYTVTDVIGHIMIRQQISSGTEHVDMPGTAPGIYTLTVAGEEPIRFVVVK